MVNAQYIQAVEPVYDTLIVGAGVSGLIAARELRSAGRRVIVLDKGRGVGGRMTTRRMGAAAFDHGAQFITVRSPRFQAEMGLWTDAGVATLWSRGFADGLTGDGSLLTATAHGGENHTPSRDGHPRYRGLPSMSAIPKYLARDAEVRLGMAVASVRRLPDGRWVARAPDGTSCNAATAVVTAPVPQAIALLDAGGVAIEAQARATLESLVYDPCLALLAVLAEPLELPEPGVLRRPHPSIEWIADNRRKGVSPEGPALTVHCSPEFSTRHYDEEDEPIASEILGALDGLAIRCATWEVKRWRYSRPTTPLTMGAWTAGLPEGLVLAGDAFAGARVEGAALSGFAAADRLHHA